MTRAVLASAIVLTALAEPAGAFQTEVDPGTMEWKREGLARWVRGEKRDRWLAEVDAAQEAATTPLDVPASYPTGVLSAAQVAAYATGAGFPESVVPTMVAIAARESGFCPTAVNPGHCGEPELAYAGGPACGLWQMYPCPGPHALDPATNAAMAYAKYVGSGYDLDPWGM